MSYRIFHVATRPDLIAEYRHLLLHDWTLDAFQRILSLARHTLLLTGLAYRLPWEQPHPPRVEQTPTLLPVPAVASDSIADYIASRNRDLLAQQPAKQAPTAEPPPLWAQLAEEARIHFAVADLQFGEPQGPVIDDTTGFYRDVRSLLFRCSIHALFPVLRSNDPRFAESLASAMSMWARYEWDDAPSHRHTLLAELYDVMGFPDPALEFRQAALAMTSPAAHEYLTSAQALVFDLVDRGRFEDAELALLAVARRAPEECLPELRTLLRMVFRQELATKYTMDPTYDLERFATEAGYRSRRKPDP